jgi:hypothetical protein
MEDLTNADDRLKFFQHDVGLHGCISAALKARSRQRLESELLQDAGKTFKILSPLYMLSIYSVLMGEFLVLLRLLFDLPFIHECEARTGNFVHRPGAS